MFVIAQLSRRQMLAFWLVLAAVAVPASWSLMRHFSPSPPRSIMFSAGATDGAYYQFAKKYEQVFADNGVTLKVQTSSGSVQNLERLRDGGGEVVAGLVQGGLGPLASSVADPAAQDDDGDVRALGVVGYEPIWVFSHKLDLSGGLTALAGKKVGVGLAGSGSHKLALELLKAYGIGPEQAQFVTESSTQGARLLVARELDALIFIAAPQAAAVTSLLQSTGIRLNALDHVEGLARRFPYLQTITLRRGSVDFAQNIPPRDTPLLATSSQLVIRNDLHPALAYLLLEAASQTHRGPSLFNRPGEFPNARATDFPLADEAERYFKSGRPFLQRYLPFWAANFVQRLIVLLVPLLAIVVPVLKAVPAILDWREKNRLFRRYGELKFLERDISQRTLSDAEVADAHKRLDQIESEARSAKFSLDFSDRVYTLRLHVDYVRHQLALYTPAPVAATATTETT